jgi:hypothetical protein
MKIDAKVQEHLKERFGPESELHGLERLGKGLHGAGYLVRFRTSEGERRLTRSLSLSYARSFSTAT